MEGSQRVRHAVAGFQDPARPRDATDLLSSCTFAFPVPLFLLLLPLPIMMVLRAARTTRLHLRFPTDPRASVTTTSGTNRSGSQSGGGSRPHRPIFSLGHFRHLSLLVVIGLRSAIAVSSGNGSGDDAKRATAVAAGVRLNAAANPGRHLDDLPDVAFDKEGSSSEGISESVAEWPSDPGKGGVGADGEGMSPAESAEVLLADGRPRCCLSDEEVGAEGGESSGRRQNCVPTVFFLGVSKCGTTSLSDWLSHHPRIRWVRRPQHLYYLEAHVFDVPPEPEEWRQSARSPSSSQLRNRLSVEAEAKDAVIDYTPHYSLIAEVPFRISEFYGGGRLRERGLKFLVVLREPAARTISSWMYKTDPKMALQVAKARHPEGLLASLSGKAVEVRPLKQAVEEGIEMAVRLSECVANATQAGGFGHGRKVTSCHSLAASVEGCKGGGGDGEEGRANGEEEQERAEGCDETSCETHIEPLCNPRDFLEKNLYDAHVGKSMYALQLARWFAVFGRDSFHVMFTEDLALDPMGTLENALAFMGLDLTDAKGIEGLRSREEWVPVVSSRRNEADPEKTAQLSSQVTAEVVGNLRSFFAPHNAALEDLLGAPLPHSWQAQR